MFSTKEIARPGPTPYATRADFCGIFEGDMNRLYLLSFLLTGDRTMAVKCFVRGLEDSGKGNPVFKEWAQSWARRMIIQNAIRMIRPRPTDGGMPDAESHHSAGPAAEPDEIENVLALPAFERFVFVMSILEGYSVQECSLLLGCTRGEAASNRIRALQRIGRSAELHREVISIATDQRPGRGDRRSELLLDALSGLPASA